MRWKACVLAVCVVVCFGHPVRAQEEETAQPRATAPPPDPNIKAMVERLELDKYKATIKELTQFGDRRQGTDRNKAALDWIEAQLKSYGCTNTERITYNYVPDAARAAREDSARIRGTTRMRLPTTAPGGAKLRGNVAPIGVNVDSLAQPDVKLRALDTEQGVPGERQEVYCTKIGATHPDEMYIVGGHMDGIGWGEAANDDGSGSAVTERGDDERRQQFVVACQRSRQDGDGSTSGSTSDRLHCFSGTRRQII